MTTAAKTAKVVLVGESNVGKSSLMQRLSAGTFTLNAEPPSAPRSPPCGARSTASSTSSRSGTSPGSRARALLPLYIQHAQLVLLCCDATTTQAERDAWASEVGGCESVVYVGTKADVTAVAGVAVQTSAKNGEGCPRHLMASHARCTAITPEQQQPSPRGWWRWC